jgi:hypothetical protein
MSRLLPAGMIILAAAFMILGIGGKLPHEWFGISTATLIGWVMVGAIPAVFFVMLLVIMDRQRQLKRDTARLLHRVGAGPKPAERGKIIQFPRRSG